MDPFSVRYDTCDETRWPRILRDVQFLNIPDPRKLTSELESPIGEVDVGAELGEHEVDRAAVGEQLLRAAWCYTPWLTGCIEQGSVGF